MAISPRIVKNGEATISSSSMSSSSKQSNVHAVTWKNRGWHHSLRSSGTPNSQKKLIFFVPDFKVLEESTEEEKKEKVYYRVASILKRVATWNQKDINTR